MTNMTFEQAQQFLYREAALIDDREFDDWLELFTEGCLFWVPARKVDGSLTQDPQRELSLIYYRGKENLRDRVDRLRSGQSVVSKLPQRVVHQISNVALRASQDDAAELRSNFVAHCFDPRTDKVSVHFGQYEHRLLREDGTWRIAAKTVHLANDVIATVLDVNAL